MPKCVETNCSKEGKVKVITLDGQVVYLCENHADLWLKNGCSLAESHLRRMLQALRVYGALSAIFYLGLFFSVYGLYQMLTNPGLQKAEISLSVPFEFYLGFLLLVLSWLISIIIIKRTRR